MAMLPFQSPEMLQAVLTDPRATPQQRAAAVAALQGGQGGPPGKALEMASSDSGGDPTEWLSAGASAAEPARAGGPDRSGGTGDLAGWRGDFMEMIKRQMAADTGTGELTGEDKALALAKAGFGMAASESPNFGTALGQGAVYGIEGLEQLKRQRAQERLRRDLGMQSGLLQAGQIEERAAQAKQASLDRQAAIKQREEDSLRDDETRRLQIDAMRAGKEAAAQAAAERAEAMEDRAYTTADRQRRDLYFKTGQWQTIAGDDKRGITGAPVEEEYAGPLIASPKISLKEKQKLEVAKPKTEQAVTLVVGQLGDMRTKAEQLLQHPGLEKATGFGGTALSKVPGTEAANFAAELESLKSGTFVNNINAMREASPTGGAVGNVTEREGDRLASLQGSLAQAQTPEQLRAALRNIVAYTERTGGTMRKAYVDTYGDKDAPHLPWEKKNPDGEKADGDKKPEKTVTYSTADDVKAAFKAGKIDRASAKKILHEQFGYE